MHKNRRNQKTEYRRILFHSTVHGISHVLHVFMGSPASGLPLGVNEGTAMVWHPILGVSSPHTQ